MDSIDERIEHILLESDNRAAELKALFESFAQAIVESVPEKLALQMLSKEDLTTYGGKYLTGQNNALDDVITAQQAVIAEWLGEES